MLCYDVASKRVPFVHILMAVCSQVTIRPSLDSGKVSVRLQVNDICVSTARMTQPYPSTFGCRIGKITMGLDGNAAQFPLMHVNHTVVNKRDKDISLSLNYPP